MVGIENENILLGGLLAPQSLNALAVETGIELFFVHTETRRQANQSRSHETAEEDDNQNLPHEFGQPTQRIVFSEYQS